MGDGEGLGLKDVLLFALLALLLGTYAYLYLDFRPDVLLSAAVIVLLFVLAMMLRFMGRAVVWWVPLFAAISFAGGVLAILVAQA